VSEHLAQARGVSPKRDPACAPASLFEPSPRRRGLAWARSFSLSEGLGEAVRCLGACLFLDDWYWFGCELYDEKHVYNGVLCMLGMNHELWMTGLVWKLACELSELVIVKRAWKWDELRSYEHEWLWWIEMGWAWNMKGVGFKGWYN